MELRRDMQEAAQAPASMRRELQDIVLDIYNRDNSLLPAWRRKGCPYCGVKGDLIFVLSGMIVCAEPSKGGCGKRIA